MKKLILLVSLALVSLALGVPSIYADTPQTAGRDGISMSVTPGGRYVGVDGDENRFRQDWWIKDGWAGGIAELTWDPPAKGDAALHFSGHAFFPEEDYALRLEIVNPNVGFIRAGYTEHRKYFDDSGGFYPFISGAQSFALGQDLQLDIGNVFVEAGLTLPNLPRLVVGYEYKFKDGMKSMLEWGTASRGSVSRNILPASKEIDDKVHIFKAEVDHDINNVHIGDQFRYERYDISTIRLDDTSWIVTNAAPGKSVTVNESYKHDAFFNTFHMESHVSDKTFWSLGYLFSTLDGEPGFSMDTEVFPANGGTSSGTDKFWEIIDASVSQNSHVLNANAMLGPYAKTYFYGGIQAEKTETDGFSDVILEETGAPDEAAVINSNNDKEWFEERLGARFTGIPFTTVYAEGKWSQGNVALFEEELVTGVSDLSIASETTRRYTDTDITREDYRVGFNTAPIPKSTLGAYYRRNHRKNDYQHLVDEEIIVDTNGVADVEDQFGYSAFITGQKVTTDEIGAKLTLRPISKLSVSLKYQLLATDFETGFASTNITTLTGNYDSQVYSVSATLMPVARLYLTGLLSYQDTRTIGQDNGSAIVTTYHGDVYSAVAALGYAFDNKTDLRAEYTFSRADDFENNFSVGLPYGLDYKRHSVLVTLSRRLGKNVVGRLAYGYYDYDESSTAGINDYTAHMGSASVAIRF